jgi:energy-coupling factor transporter ATP-binding protein EcfA2
MLRARDNPFATERVLKECYRLDEAGWAELMKRWEVLGRRGALVGPHGSGKTTLLEDMAVRLTKEGWRAVWVRLSAEFPRLPAECAGAFFARLGVEDIVLLDGAEQLGPVAWWIFRYRVRRAGGLVITTHRAGRLGTLRRCETTQELLVELVAALGEELSAEEAKRLHTRHRGNVREVLRELYDEHAG